MNFSGKILGYDPGGNGVHGVALATITNGQIQSLEIQTLTTAEDVIKFAFETSDLNVLAIDTLTTWSTGLSGWRPADRWLKKKYKKITHSIASANSLFGSMGLNGMSVMAELRRKDSSIRITETHPKVLYFELSGDKYDYKTSSNNMDAFLSELLGIQINTSNDHEWDAVVSIYAAIMGYSGQWTTNLHTLPVEETERLVKPAGDSEYWWPIT
ncbi:DUF429 domain-containing protein [Vibrio owensii]|uniref:DUF429 domain-containing protein n=1 Tax=Vibrio owensii TaxID=696485 RepID=UPI00148E3BD7|nr:DUF429 domain-containing protein [Vibrio owensii]NOI73876.1 DUF429 domain-containing protein [Vibrio owensii]